MSVTITVTDKAGNKATATVNPVIANTTRFPGDPGPGKLYYGMSVKGGNPATREAFFGHNVGLYRSYWQPTQIASMVTVCKRDLAVGRLPLPSIKLPATWQVMASGAQDAWFKQLFDGLATVPGPVWLCLHHEPYDDQWDSNNVPIAGQTPAYYVAMNERAMTLKPANVAIVPILQSAPFDKTTGGTQNILNWYSAKSCDIAGLDGYNHWYAPNGNKWRTPAQVFSVADALKTLGKPMLFAEYGVRTDPANPGKAAQWLQDAHDYMLARGDMVAMSYFDSDQNVNDGGTPWSLDYNGDTERLDQFKKELARADNAWV